MFNVFSYIRILVYIVFETQIKTFSNHNIVSVMARLEKVIRQLTPYVDHPNPLKSVSFIINLFADDCIIFTD